MRPGNSTSSIAAAASTNCSHNNRSLATKLGTMVTTSPEKTAQILVVHNPQASAYGLEPLRGLMDRHFAGRRVAYLECSRTEMAARLTPWLQSGGDLVVAAGGGGTVGGIFRAPPPGGGAGGGRPPG